MHQSQGTSTEVKSYISKIFLKRGVIYASGQGTKGGVINQTKNLEILHFPENCHTLKDIDIWIRVKAPNQGGVINQPKNLEIL